VERRDRGGGGRRQQRPQQLKGHARLRHDHVAWQSPRRNDRGHGEHAGTASHADYILATDSSKGPTLLDRIVKPDLVAPGNKIVAAMSMYGRFRNNNRENILPQSYYTQNGSTQPGDEYFWMSGNSMATPVVSGAAALLLHKTPGLTPDQVKYRLIKTAAKSFPLLATATDAATGTNYSVRHDAFSVGAGYLDIAAAINNTETPTKRAYSPAAVYNSTTRSVTVTSLWGTNVIWGETGTYAHNVIWGTSTTTNAETDTLLLQGDCD